MTLLRKLSKKHWFPDKKVIPSSRLIWFFAISTGLVGIGAMFGVAWLFFGIANGVLLALVTVDYQRSKRLPKIFVERECHSMFEIAEENELILRIQLSEPWTGRMWVQDDYPFGFRVSQRTFLLKWDHETEKQLRYTLVPHRRGRHHFAHVHFRMESQWGLLLIQKAISADWEVLVYPRMKEVRKVKQGIYRRQLATEGTPMLYALGAGHEFSHLREYLPDDEPRRINWMATARAGKLVSNVYLPEAGQEVAIVVDCGRMMGIRHEGVTQLDLALEAALGYALLALQRGDRVSFLAFSDQVVRWIPPGKGNSHFQRILDSSFDLEPSFAESNFLLITDLLNRSHRPKTLVTLFTDAANLIYSQTASLWIAQMRKKHLVLTITCQDDRLVQWYQQESKELQEIYERLAYESWFAERKHSLDRLRGKRVEIVDVPSQKMAVQAIQSYLAIRRKRA